MKSENFYKTRNESLRLLGFENYKQYLKSEIWQTIRKLVYERDCGKCQVCGKRATDIHHNSYEIDALIGKKTSFTG